LPKVTWVAINPKGSRPPLFWITPDASQGDLFRRLGRDQPIYCMRAPKVPQGSPPLTLRELAQCHIASIRQIQPQGPYQVAGYCIAAVVAREVALELSASGEHMSRVIMVDPPDPEKSKRSFPPDGPWFRVSATLSRVAFHMRRLSRLSWAEKLRYMQASARAVVGRFNYAISKRAHERSVTGDRPLPDRFNDGYHSAVAAFLNSVPKIYEGEVIMFRPDMVPQAIMDSANRRWSALIAPSMRIQKVAGDSNTMWAEPNVADIADQIGRLLASRQLQS
jgi:thioesterase domain-containing protein